MPVFQQLMQVTRLQAGCDLILLCNESPIKGGAALDELLAGLQTAHASGLWTPEEDSEHRRLALLPQSAPLTWDELMADPGYHAALEQLPG